MRGVLASVACGALGCAATTSAQRSDANPPTDVVAVGADASDTVNAGPETGLRGFSVRVESIDRLGRVRALPNAAVALDRGGDPRRLVETDALGIALFPGILTGTVDITAAHRGQIARSLLGVPVTDGERVVSLEGIDLPPSRTVRGEVRGLTGPQDELLLTLSSYGERLLTSPQRYEMEIPVESGGLMVAALIHHGPRFDSVVWLTRDFPPDSSLDGPVDLDFTGDVLPSARAIVVANGRGARGVPIGLAQVDCGVTLTGPLRSTLSLGVFSRATAFELSTSGNLDFIRVDSLPAHRVTTFCRAIYPSSGSTPSGAFSELYRPGYPIEGDVSFGLPRIPSSLPDGLRSGSTFTVTSPEPGVRYGVRVTGFPGVRTWEIELAEGATTGRIPALPSAMLASSILSDGPTAQVTACYAQPSGQRCAALAGSPRTRFNR